MADYAPWHPMTDPVDKKTIGKLMEELGELTEASASVGVPRGFISAIGRLVAACARCFIQGLLGREPTTGKSNKQWFEEEIADVLANIDLNVECFDLDTEFIECRREEKKAKLRTWHDMA